MGTTPQRVFCAHTSIRIKEPDISNLAELRAAAEADKVNRRPRVTQRSEMRLDCSKGIRC